MIAAERDPPRLLPHLVVDRVVGEEEVDGVVAPPEPALPVAHQRGRRRARRQSTPSGAEGVDHVAPALDGHEDVEVDVDRRSRLGVVGEGEGAAERVGDPAPHRVLRGSRSPCPEGWAALELAVRTGALMASLRSQAGGSERLTPPPSERKRVGEEEQVDERSPPLLRGGGHPFATERAASRAGDGSSLSRCPLCEQVGQQSAAGSDRAVCPLPSSAISSRAARSTGGRATGGSGPPGRPPKLLGARWLRRLSRAFSMTSSVSSRKEARVRLRGPFGVPRDSRISNLPALSRNDERHSG